MLRELSVALLLAANRAAGHFIGRYLYRMSSLSARKNALARRLGRHPLSNMELNREGAAMFGGLWGGAWDQPGFVALPPRPNRYYVVNTSYAPRSPGVHWVAVYVTPAGVFHVYDSFGRDVDVLLSRALKGRRVVQVNGEPDQYANSAICGHASLAWLAMVRDTGVRAATAAESS